MMEWKRMELLLFDGFNGNQLTNVDSGAARCIEPAPFG